MKPIFTITIIMLATTAIVLLIAGHMILKKKLSASPIYDNIVNNPNVSPNGENSKKPFIKPMPKTDDSLQKK
jgi:hypothetical protein